MVEAYQLLISIEHESQGGENHFGYGLAHSLHDGGYGSHLFHVYALGKASTVHGRIWWSSRRFQDGGGKKLNETVTG